MKLRSSEVWRPFNSPLLVELVVTDLFYSSIMITALVLAAKFYCETQDVVVNADIAKLLCSLNKTASFDLNAMEATLADLVDFDLFVSQQEYNKEAGKLNI